MKIVLAGGSGFIGTPLVKALCQAGHSVILLTRSSKAYCGTSFPNLTQKIWDPAHSASAVPILSGCDAVINLAGENIAARRWTPEQKHKIQQSRIQTARTLAEAILQSSPKPALLINASAVGYYGHVAEEAVTESFPAANDFLGTTCALWEETALKAETVGTRVVLLRFGIVLGREGGALKKMVPLFQYFVGGHLGSSRQWMPWVHREDVLDVVLYTLKKQDLSGPVNVVAPNPVRMSDFAKTLGRVLGRPSWAHVPEFALRFMLGEMSTILVTGQRAVPKKLQDSGYSFRYSQLEDALRNILNA